MCVPQVLLWKFHEALQAAPCSLESQLQVVECPAMTRNNDRRRKGVDAVQCLLYFFEGGQTFQLRKYHTKTVLPESIS